MRKKKQTRICCDGVNTAIMVCKGNKFVERKKTERQRPCGSFVLVFALDEERLCRFHDSILPITDNVFIIPFYCWCETDTGGHIKKGIQKRWRLCTDTVCCHRIVAEKTNKTEFIKYLYCSATLTNF